MFPSYIRERLKYLDSYEEKTSSFAFKFLLKHIYDLVKAVSAPLDSATPLPSGLWCYIVMDEDQEFEEC